MESARLRFRDYRQPGDYFVTVCNKGRVPWFGEIRAGMMGLHDAGCTYLPASR